MLARAETSQDRNAHLTELVFMEDSGNRGPSTPPRAQRWRRRLVIAAATLTLPLLVLHSSWFEGLVARFAERTAQRVLGGTASIEKLRLQPLRGSVTLSGLEMRPDSERLAIALEIASVTVKLRGGIRLAVRLDQPRLEARIRDSDSTAQGKPLLNGLADWLDLARVGEVEIVDAELLVAHQASPFELRVSDLHATSVRGPDGHAITLATPDAELVLPGGEQGPGRGGVSRLHLGPLSAQGQARGTGIDFTTVHAESGGSHLDASGHVDLAGGFGTSLAGDFELHTELLSRWVSTPLLNGVLKGQAEMSFADDDLTGRAQVTLRTAPGPEALPALEGNLELVLAARRLDLRTENLRLAGAVLAADLQLADWRRLTGRYRLDWPALSTSTALTEKLWLAETLWLVETLSLPAAASLVADGEVYGTLDAPRLSLRGSLGPLVFEARVDRDAVRFDRIDLEGGKASPLLTGDVALEAPYPATFELDLAAAPLLELATALTAGNTTWQSLAGRGSVELRLDLAEPAGLRYHGQVDEIVGEVAQRRVRVPEFGFEGDLDELRLRGVRIEGEHDTRVRIDGKLALSASSTFDLEVNGEASLALLGALSEDLVVNGLATVDLRLAGTSSAPQLVGEARFADVEGSWREIEWSGLGLSVSSADGCLRLDSLAGEVMGAQVTAEGLLPFARSPDGPWRVEVEIDRADLADLAGALENTELRLTASGKFEGIGFDLDSVTGSGTAALIGRHAEHRFATDGSAAWQLENRQLAMSGMNLVGEVADARIDATAVLASDGVELDATVAGHFELVVLGEPLRRSGFGDVEGDVEIAVDLSRRGGAWSWNGTAQLDGGELALLRPRILATAVRVSIAFEEDRVRLDSFSGTIGGGAFDGRGTVELPELSALGAVELELDAEHMAVEMARGVSGVVSGSLALSGGGEVYRLAGDVRVERGRVNRELNEAGAESQFMASIRRGLRLGEPTFVDRLELDLRWSTPGDVRIANSMADLSASAQLRVTGTAGEPIVDGIVVSQNVGTVRLGRHQYDILRGQVELRGYPTRLPRLDVDGFTRVGGVGIDVRLSGPVDEVVMSLASTENPNLNQADLMSLLLTGRTVDEASAGVTEMATARAATFIGDLLSKQLGRDLGLVFGNPVPLPILQTETGPESRFTVGREIAGDLRFAYSVGLDNSQEQLWILDYQPWRNVWARAIQQNGSVYTLELAHRIFFDVRHQSRPTFARPRSRQRVTSIVLEGAPIPQEQLRARLDLSVGSRYEYWRAYEDARRMAATLIEAGYLGAAVDVSVAASEPGGIDLRYLIEASEPLEIVWRGDDPGEKVRREVEASWDGRLLTELQVPNIAERTRLLLRSQGYYKASVDYQTSVDARLEDDVSEHRLVYDVKLGPKGKGLVLDFEGNAALTDEQLSAELPPTDQPAFFALFEASLSTLEDLVAVRYADLGYLDVRLAGEPGFELDGDTGELRVRIPIVEGEPTVIGKIDFIGNENLPSNELIEALGFVEGDVFGLRSYLHSRGDVGKAYRREGFWDTRVTARADRRGGELLLTYQVAEGTRAHAGRIDVLGNEVTRERLIRSRLTFGTGDAIGEDDIEASKRRLYELGVFRAVNFSLSRREDSHVRDVRVEVTEKDDLILEYGVRFRQSGSDNANPGLDIGGDDGLELVGRAQVLQPFGSAGTLITSLFGLVDRRVGRVRYARPLFFGMSIPTQLYLEGEEGRREPLFLDFSQWNLNFQQQKQINDRLRLIWSYQYGHARLGSEEDARRIDELGIADELPIRIGDEIYQGRIAGSLLSDRRNNPIQPTDGYLWHVNVQWASPRLGASFSYLRLFGQASYLFPFGPQRRRWVWASGISAGTVVTGDPFIFFDDRFTAGGAYSVRGFRTNGLGPKLELTGDPIGGEALFIFNQELRFPIQGNWGGAVFYDAGNAWSRSGDFALDDLRHSAGVGIRWNLSIGVVRLDWGYVLDREPGEDGSRFHLAFGNAF